ncbi:hypothetical protein PIROE2DRAFT_59730 [Piromyces sp. E2]|nr:hypothetical protein PIROE2DRAFT_59730 [Piromyces sp. E2]|eukprot:OUM65885.1 hypothetical protein PIROE2DRAFT_59730 [Piromyces sp. E2]
MSMVAFSLYIIYTYKLAIDINLEKKIFRKQYMYAYGFGLIKFYFSWTIVYSILVLPTSIIIIAVIYFLNLFPDVSFYILLLSFYIYQVSAVVIPFWVASYFSYTKDGAAVSVLVNICLAVNYFCITYFNRYRKNREDEHDFEGIITIGHIIHDIKKTVNKGNSIGFFDMFTKDYISIFADIAVSFGCIVSYFLLGLITDFFLNSKHLRMSWTDKKLKSRYHELVISNPKGKEKTQSASEEGKEMEEEQQNYFDVDEFQNLFKKTNKNEEKYTGETDNDSIQLHRRGNVIIEAKNVFKKFKTSEELALCNISLKVYSNELTIITGTSDSGKSTLMKILSGHLGVSYGEVTVFGKKMDRWKWKHLSKMINVSPKKDYVLIEDLTVADNIKLYSSMCSPGEDGFRLLQELNYTKTNQDFIKNLDDVEKTKIKVAIALMKPSPIVFIEEPTSNMMDNDRIFFWNAVRARKCKRTFIISTQFIDEALTYGDRIVILNNGMLHCNGNHEFVKNHITFNDNAPGLTVSVET